MTVSVVIPAYGHRDFIVLALESVFSQTFRDFEVIVVNDGSPDDTESVLSPWIASGRIRYVSQPNAGQGSARNRGISVARGEFVALLDDDDLWPSDKLAWQVQALRDHPEAAVVYGRIELIGADGTAIEKPEILDHLPLSGPGGDIYDTFIVRNYIVSPGQTLVRRSALERLGPEPFDVSPAMKGCDDWDLWLRLAQNGPFLFEDRLSLRYRFHGGNASADRRHMHYASLTLWRKHLTLPTATPERREVVRRVYESYVPGSQDLLIDLASKDRDRFGPSKALQELWKAGAFYPELWRQGRFRKLVLVTLVRTLRPGGIPRADPSVPLRISVVIPTFNRAAYLRRTIASVLSQSRPPDEIVIVDDGSTDDTEKVVAALGETRIRYTRQNNGGQGSARNRGWHTASGDALLFLDDDDLLLPTALESLEAALKTNPSAAAAYCRSQAIDESDRVTEAAWPHADATGPVWRALMRYNFIRSPGAVLIRRSHLARAGNFLTAERYRGNEDWEQWLRLASAAPFVRVEAPLFQYRVHSGGVSQDPVRQHRTAVAVIRRHALRNLFRPYRWGALRDCDWRLRVTLSELIYQRSHAAVGQGEWSRGVRLLMQAVWVRPGLLRSRSHWAHFPLRRRQIVPLALANGLGLTGLVHRLPASWRTHLRPLLRQAQAPSHEPATLLPLLPRPPIATTQRDPAAPLVSVVIPAYGHRDFIVLALESVFSQTFRDFEVIVVNDGSPDDTESVLSPWIASGRIRYVSQPNAGQGSARNRGISVARGEFVALLDDDDLWPSDKLSWQVQALRDHPEAAVVYGFPEPIGLDGTTVEPRDWYGDILPWPWTAPQGKMYAPLCARCWLVSPGQALVRRSALDALTGSGDAGPFDTGLGGSDDWDLWLRLSEAWEFVFEERPALRYRLHGGNASRNTIQMRENGLAVYRKHLRRHAADPERRAVIAAWYDFLRRDTPRYLLRQAYRDRARGDIAMALRKLRYAFRHEPRLLGEGDAWKFFLVTLLRARQDGASIARRDQDWHGQRQEQK